MLRYRQTPVSSSINFAEDYKIQVNQNKMRLLSYSPSALRKRADFDRSTCGSGVSAVVVVSDGADIRRKMKIIKQDTNRKIQVISASGSHAKRRSTAPTDMCSNPPHAAMQHPHDTGAVDKHMHQNNVHRLLHKLIGLP
jgi:hypothetical protein